jgi:hypothetical protein
MGAPLNCPVPDRSAFEQASGAAVSDNSRGRPPVRWGPFAAAVTPIDSHQVGGGWHAAAQRTIERQAPCWKSPWNHGPSKV